MTLRQRATNQWYGDGRIPLKSQRGPFSASYRRFLARASASESRRYGSLLPSSSQPAPTSSLSEAAPFTTTASATVPTWVNMGPTQATFATNGPSTLNVTDSGRVRSIIVNGSTIYVASAGGGVWKSTNSGSTWEPITDGLSSLSDGSLAMDPNDSSTLYLGLGDPFDGTGIGLVKSTDGGGTWSDPVFLGNERTIPQVMVDPSDSSVVLAATDDGLYRSTNAGASFSQVSIATGQAGVPKVWSIASTGAHSFTLSLEALPNQTSGTTDGQVWTSANDGASWTRANGMTNASGLGRITLASAPSNPQIVYAMAAIPNSFVSADLADIYKSTDGGQTWTALGATGKAYTNPNTDASNVNTILNGQGWYNQLVAVDPTNPDVAYFGGALLLAKTTDGGTTFTQKSNWLGQFGLPYVHADLHTATFDASGNLYVGSDGGIFKSSDGGSTFTDSLNVGLVDQLLYSVGSSPNDTNAVIGGFQDLGTRLREASTSTFDQVIGGDGFGSDINRADAQLMLGSLYYDQIRKSTNGGSSWANATTGLAEANDPSHAPFFTKIVPWQGTGSTGNELYTFSNFKVYESTNYAGSWTALPTAVTNTGNIRNIGVAAGNSGNDVGVVASGGRIFLSSNGGTSWTSASSPPNNGLSLSDIHFDPSDPNTVYVGSVAPTQSASHLWKSADFGAHWTSIDGYGAASNGFPQGVPVNVVTTDPQDPTILYAGTQLGLYRSTDGGSTWSRFGAGMPLVSVTGLYISPDSTLMRAASYGRGLWQLTEVPVERNLTVSKAGSGTGTVVSSPAGISCGATCSAQYNDGDSVTLTATATAGSTFAGWSGGGCADTGPCNVAMDADKAITATFDDTSAPYATAPIQTLVRGAQLGTTTVPVRFAWSASDNVTPSASIQSTLQQRTSSNGTTWTSYSNLFGPTTAKTATRSFAPAGTFRQFRVTAKDEAGKVGPGPAGPALRVNTYQESSPAIAYSGTRHGTAESGAFGGQVRSSSQAGAKATLTSTGRNLAVVMPLAPTEGTARICIDGAYCLTVDLSPASGLGSRKEVYVRNGLAASTTHKVQVTVLSGRVDLDGFVALR